MKDQKYKKINPPSGLINSLTFINHLDDLNGIKSQRINTVFIFTSQSERDRN